MQRERKICRPFFKHFSGIFIDSECACAETDMRDAILSMFANQGTNYFGIFNSFMKLYNQLGSPCQLTSQRGVPE